VVRASSARTPEESARGPEGRGRLAAVRGNGPRQAAALDQVIHERKRLAIVSALAVHESLSFTELKSLVGITDGNLSVHARKLEDAGYVECRKGFAGRVPRTDFRLTVAGRRALDGYLDHMEALIRRTRDG
jgi:DNA-binding transcriptional ArsR family regulator